MTEMNVGRLVAYASIDSKIFEAGELKIRRALIDLNRALGTSVAGVRELDLSMIAGAESATDLGAGLARAAKASTDSTRATQRDAAAEDKRNASLARARELVASVAGEEKRLQQSLIRQAAVTDRVTEAEERGNLTARQYLANQAAMIGASRSVASAQAAAGASIAATGRKMESAGKSIGRHITLPVLAAIGVSAHLASTFDSTMTRIQTQAGASAGDVKVLAGEVLDLAKTAEQGPTQLAQALYHLKSVGLDNVDAMTALKQASDLAAVGGANLEDTTNALAGAWRTGIRGATDFHAAVRTLNAVVGAGNMSMSDLNAALGTGILPTAKTFGLTLTDVGSALALFTDEGVSADSAATRLRMTFSLLGAPSQVAQKQLKSIGITANELGADMRKPQGLIVAIGDLKSHLDDSGLSATKQAALLSRAFGGGRSSSAILSLINNYDVLGKKQDQVTAGIAKYDQAVATQRKTPTAQFHLLGAELERTSILLGNAVLPDLIKLTSATASAVRGFDNLSHTQKEILGWGVGTLAALGPILAIGGRLVLVGQGIGTFVTGASARLAAFAGASEATSATVGLSMARMGAAMAGAGVGIAAGELTKNSSNATKALGALAAAGVGAAIGFGVGGPVGAAVGGLAGGVGSLAVSFLHAGHAGESASDKAAAAARRAQAAILAQQQAVDTLTGAIETDSNAIGKNTRAQVTNDLQKSGALKLAAQANLNLHDVTGAALGHQKAQDALNAQISRRSAAAINEPGGLINSAASREMARLLPLLRQEGIVVGKAGAAADLAAESMGKLSFATRSVSDQTRRYGTDIDQTTVAGRANIKFIHDHVAALDKERSSGKLTDQQWVTQLGTLQRQFKQYGYNAGAVRTYLAGFAKIPASVRTALLADPAIANSAIGTVLRSIGTVPTAKNTDLTARDKATPTITGLGGVLDRELYPRSVSIDADTSAAMLKMQALLNAIPSGTFHFNVDAAYRAQDASVNPRGSAAGSRSWTPNGKLPPGYSTVGERGWELVKTDHSGRSEVYSHEQSRAMTGMPDRLPGFAGGTVGGNIAATQSWLHGVDSDPYVFGAAGPHAWDCSGLVSGAIEHLTGHGSGRLFSTSNEGSALAGLGFKHGAGSNAAMVVGWEHDSHLEHTTGMVGGLKFEAYGSNGVPLKDQIRVGSRARDPRSFPNVMHLPGGGAAKPEGDPSSSGGGIGTTRVDGKKKFTYGGQIYASKAAAENAQQRATSSGAASRLAGARSAVGDARKLGHIAATPLNTDLRSQLGTLDADLRKAGLPKTFLDGLGKENTHILALARSRNIAFKHLTAAEKGWMAARKAMRADFASFRGSVIGSFDITSAGKDDNGRVTGGSLRAAQAQDLTRVRQYVTDLTKLSRKGIFPPAYLRQLASQGPDALPTIKALLSMSAPQLAGFARNQQEIARLGGQVATVAATRLDQGTIDRRAKLVREDRKLEAVRQKRLEDAMGTLGDRIEQVFDHLHLEATLGLKHGEFAAFIDTDRRRARPRTRTHA